MPKPSSRHPFPHPVRNEEKCGLACLKQALRCRHAIAAVDSGFSTQDRPHVLCAGHMLETYHVTNDKVSARVSWGA